MGWVDEKREIHGLDNGNATVTGIILSTTVTADDDDDVDDVDDDNTNDDEDGDGDGDGEDGNGDDDDDNDDAHVRLLLSAVLLFLCSSSLGGGWGGGRVDGKVPIPLPSPHCCDEAPPGASLEVIAPLLPFVLLVTCRGRFLLLPLLLLLLLLLLLVCSFVGVRNLQSGRPWPGERQWPQICKPLLHWLDVILHPPGLL